MSARIVGFLAVVIRLTCLLFALVLAAHVALTWDGANPTKDIVASWANHLGFHNLFNTSDEKQRVLLKSGLPAVLWLAVGLVLPHQIRRLSRAFELLRDPYRPVNLSNFGATLLARSKCTSQPAQPDQAITAFRNALAASSRDDPNRLHICPTLALRYRPDSRAAVT